MSALADDVHLDRSIVRYVREVAEASRELTEVRLGLSARGCLAWTRAAKTWALSRGRGHVVPEDVTVLAPQVLGHRLLLEAEAYYDGVRSDDVVQRLLTDVPAPRDRA